MIKVMCNNNPIIGLSTIDKLEFLWKMVETIIPEEVYKEILIYNKFRLSENLCSALLQEVGE